jgi:hypothetical protein
MNAHEQEIRLFLVSLLPRQYLIGIMPCPKFVYRMRDSGPNSPDCVTDATMGSGIFMPSITIILIIFLDRDSAAFENHTVSCNTTKGKSATVAEHLVAAIQVRKQSDKT